MVSQIARMRPTARRSRTLTPSLVVGLILGGILVLVAIIAPMVLGQAAEALGGGSRQGPSPEHLLGTDALGRDVLARSLVATRLTLLMAAGATAVSVVAGVLLGGMIWLAPRRLREVVLRIVDASVAFPALVLALVIAAILGPGSMSAVIAIGVAGIPSFARLTSNMVAGVVQRDFVTTARLLGVPGFRLFSRHLLPNISGPLLVLTTSSFALALLEIASLSFVGLGVQSPQFDFGQLLSDGLTGIYTQPWQALAPAIMLVYTGITAMLIGDGLAQTLDPGLRLPRKAAAVTPTPREASAPRPDALVEVDDLHVFAPNGTELVRGVGFAIGRGEVLGLVGESGSGKSMTAMAVAGLLADGVRSEARTVRLDDMDLTGRNDPRRLATEIGLVYQDPGTTFNPALRMGGQLAEVARIHLGLGRRAARTRVREALDRIHVRDSENRMKQHAFQWSGGMLQRATIAAAVLTDPKLIIADEPTTALDVTVQAEVLRQFRRINREQGTAMLFISHDIGVVQELCDHVLVMRSGEIIERLTGADLKAGRAEHSYTRQLLAASPRMDAPIRTRTDPASASPPAAADAPQAAPTPQHSEEARS
ncbi:dipeptide/oligopeptide/nickel ABC transporter permease/ATP-binding protein [Leucobacter rhizosphaerae]|uniref:Dipeptide/oligopeptide/nickel ABC transporter permease/ATP-binding protein n=1 Tax=Leucobacter rhizosphaerae TaxID=2932245 RepID=A0ABY4FS37_9MICO|nr:dipeptide/oligopeptide/nickel ABC transporter permease/ATP-binding protein [Leucobacter rhizosphaerae]UOQ59067.1 dipeptide/oligopeptide/nickel ABC transporter permease/ATP-binding protein [Leucobacter rhizosphaerae]